MMASNEVVLLKSSLDIHCKNYSVKLTASEVYWEAATTSGRTPASGPYSEPLVSKYASITPRASFDTI